MRIYSEHHEGPNEYDRIATIEPHTNCKQPYADACRLRFHKGAWVLIGECVEAREGEAGL